MSVYRIKALPLSSMDVDQEVFTYRFGYGKKITVPNVMWFIEGADKNILVDTSCDAELATAFKGVPAKGIMSFEEGLAKVHVKPEDIDIVIQTHLHWDHCANTYKCKNAKVLVQEEEFKFAYSPHPIMWPTYKKKLFTGLNFVFVNGSREVAPGIDLIPTPGHTPGTMSVAVNTEKGKAIITGFCCVRENFFPPEGVPEEIREGTPVIIPGVHFNVEDSFRSVLLVKSTADIIVASHADTYMEVRTIP